ncbi:MAG TPA: response regulator, partial [Pyrinomonadaceae bacterium]
MLSGRPKLLLADDSPTIRKVVSLTFGDEGMEVVTVGDGAGALRALAEDPPPDLLLADVVMPGPDGYELCERVKRDERLGHVPVVLLVGTFEPFNEAEARRVGADTVLTKPFQSIRDLVSKVGSLLGGGEPKEEEAGRADEARAPLGESHAAAAAPSPRAEARAGADSRPAEVAPEESRGPDHASSFADLGADDELIEARPADAFGAAAGPARRAGSAVFAGVEERSESVLAEEPRAQQAEGVVMHEETFPETSFETRSAGAAAADDALLDLGQVDTPATASATEADDFVLDLDLDEETPAPRRAADADVWAEPAREAQPAAQVWADAPSAFAEAAHGEPRAHFGEPQAHFDAADEAPSGGQPEASDESASIFSEPSFEAAAPDAD